MNLTPPADQATAKPQRQSIEEAQAALDALRPAFQAAQEALTHALRVYENELRAINEQIARKVRLTDWLAQTPIDSQVEYSLVLCYAYCNPNIRPVWDYEPGLMKVSIVDYSDSGRKVLAVFAVSSENCITDAYGRSAYAPWATSNRIQ